jgi:hypothetical protein
MAFWGEIIICKGSILPLNGDAQNLGRKSVFRAVIQPKAGHFATGLPQYPTVSDVSEAKLPRLSLWHMVHCQRRVSNQIPTIAQ